ncbi:bifunctional phosphopantothenoylcysteine decarboxylase/phosphopantothenate--cysteine ligase CoaBC [Priestia megaterium]|jgi:phosphopantothenoylcysteine decarboxylase/phosphopantothenate--cysteine ligase|uniref:bifunctional phosphopantothenoylcysteine decarboxylase/phosphopantothenate--cysteine ligase CoaBC n=1 Tax=Priestia megaterium TaxID=1404 RepID=UPI0004702CD7|nr:bifunctional phosphopantothenoylcysteine decarboxylase/phosphopantothenate--cysteine ligase CoaBC [Priestia megaterium]MCM3182844.1 bifunctional phosphopantothenoylcysteine decarboxylase/phosphopantothenate--cysteine ligase CoaBC [Priestia megaterium]PFA97026.1 bifunctional phosphopantothenoylcysteine decarboxylase/phosphopantothenate--cysteine ligase CoaBC [Priestia megaterium]PFR95312.1 bifunctional phosphopantothenoylcysteine decarboxylase/phosphopantothenate--cysteine ligase CoaBC [Priest
MMKGKRILLCVSGGIAVYKAAALTSKLVQAGAEVKVMMTASACEFVTPLTFQALSRNPVYTDTFDEKDPSVIAHIDLADWPDLILVAPATANMIGKIANGLADDMISTTLLAATAPVWIAPAMNVHMYDHPAVKKNMSTLSSFGYSFVEPGEGYLACGYVGKGRLEEPETIVSLIGSYFSQASHTQKILEGVNVLVTAGPTVERIDPVRFFTNRSTGKMGYALAEQAAKLGASVTLVTGPTNLEYPKGVQVVQIESAQQMLEAVMQRYQEADVVIKSAAVADYRPKHVFDQKMKKQPGEAVLELERTTDILRTLGERKEHQLLVGFAAETEQVDEYAQKKLSSKNLDMIVANNVTTEGAGFGTDTNIVTLYKRSGESRKLPILSKHDVATEVLKEVKEMLEGLKK